VLGRIVIWNANDGFPLATIAKAHQPQAVPNAYGVVPGGVLGAQFTADGRIASVGRDSAIRVWSADGKAKSSSPRAEELLTKVTVSFDGKLAIAGDYQGRIVIWDGQKAVTLAAHQEISPSVSAQAR
jgi:hypothetical protein